MSIDQNVNNWSSHGRSSTFWYFYGVCINLVITLMNTCQHKPLQPMDSVTDSNQNHLFSWSLIPNERRGQLGLTETYKWLILWGVLLCSAFEHYCQWAKASSLPKHATFAVSTCACLGKQQALRLRGIQRRVKYFSTSFTHSCGGPCAVRVTQQENLHEWAMWLFLSVFDGKERLLVVRPYLKVSLATSCKDPAGIETPRKRREEKSSPLNALTFPLPWHKF